jgi:hypothetical protein
MLLDIYSQFFKDVNFPSALLSNSVDPRPAWEASQEIPRLLCNPDVYYLNHKSRQTVPIQERSITSMGSSPHFNIVLPSMPRSYMWPLSLRFIPQNHLCTSPLPCICYLPR